MLLRPLRVLTVGVLTLAVVATTVALPTPRAQAATLSLTFEAGTAEHIILGDLASRSQSKAISVGGTSAPYTVFGTDSRTGETYSYLTDVDYQNGDAGEQRESDERSFSDKSFTFDRQTVTYADIEGSERTDILYLMSDGNCNNVPNDGEGDNTLGGVETYCSVFGPEVWTSAFDATDGQALAFDYAAEAGDNYEIYAFLVAVTCTDPSDLTTCDYGGGKAENATDPLDTHTLFLHRRGEELAWSTASGAVPGTGTYRFRFVDGAFDKSGGKALGTDFYIDPASLVLGAAQTITFTQPSDILLADASTTISATSSAGLTVTVASLTTSVCTIADATVTLVAEGTCTLRANAAGGTVDGTAYVAASTVIRNFEVLAAATAPVNSGLPAISGSPVTGTTLTALDGVWGDAASPITATSYQWTATVDGVSTDIAGATSSTYVLPCSLEGATIRVRVTKTNGVGSTAATSAATTAVTVGTCPSEGSAPAPASSPVADPEGGLPVVTPPGSTSGSVGGVPTAPTPSVPTSGTAKYEVGVVQAEVRTGGAGTVSGPSSAPVLQVVRDRVATVGGGGMAPGGIVEVWMPLPGGGSRQVALLPVGEDGSFDGALPFTGELDGNGPLPIGERTIQLYGTDANGQLTVVNVGIRVEQPGPLAPEPERAPGAPPTLTPGQSLATNAGLPTPVVVTPLPGERTTRVQGDGWLLEIDVPEGTVRDEAGAPIMEVVAGDDTEVRGTGFMPGTRAYVWIMSDPTFLGEVTIRSDGTFAGDLPVDVAPGQHTLQVSGVGTDGYVRAANLGVIVLAGDGTLRPNRVAAGEGSAPLLPLRTGTLALALAAGLGAATLTRRRTPTT